MPLHCIAMSAQDTIYCGESGPVVELVTGQKSEQDHDPVSSRESAAI